MKGALCLLEAGMCRDKIPPGEHTGNRTPACPPERGGGGAVLAPGPVGTVYALCTVFGRKAISDARVQVGTLPASTEKCPWVKMPGTLPGPGDYDLNRRLTEKTVSL